MNSDPVRPLSPFETLKNEHEVILRALASFEVMLKRLEAGDGADPARFGLVVDFIRGYADRRHHAKEEDFLFPAMGEAGIPEAGGPVSIMLEEHDQGREYVGQVSDGVAKLTTEPEGARKKILDNGWAFVQLLQAHIHKENEILFPMAEQVIRPEEIEELRRKFEEADAKEPPDSFLRMVEELALGS